MRQPRHGCRRAEKRHRALAPQDARARVHIPHAAQHPRLPPRPVEHRSVRFHRHQVRRGRREERPRLLGEGARCYGFEVVAADERF